MSSVESSEGPDGDTTASHDSTQPTWEDLLDSRRAWTTWRDVKLSSEDNIRLLIPNRVSNESIECLLLETPLALATSAEGGYCALSYCWGDEPQDHRISINGKPFAVTRNLYNALQAERSFREEPHIWASVQSVPRTLWVDAICINQDDIEEKSVQVQRMNQIYRGATRILVWLGTEHDNSQLVMRVLRWLEANLTLKRFYRDASGFDVSREQRDLTRYTELLLDHHSIDQAALNALYALFVKLLDDNILTHIIMSDHERSAILENTCNRNHLFAKDHLFWPAFFSLANRPWFRRVWTYQEIELARKATVLCGSSTVDWVIFEWSHKHLLSTAWRDKLWSGKFSSGDRLSGRRYLDLAPEYAKVRTLPYLLGNPGGREAKDPRDYVFGWLGLFDDESHKLGIKANYSLSTYELFLATTKAILEQPNGLEKWCELMEELMYVPYNIDLGLPSWCPDFSWANQDRSLLHAGRERISRFVVDSLQCVDTATVTNETSMHGCCIQLDEITHSATDTPSVAHFDTLMKADELSEGPLPWAAYLLLDENQRWISSILNILTSCESQLDTGLKKWSCTLLDADDPSTDDQLIPQFQNWRVERPQQRLHELQSDRNSLVQFCKDVVRPAIKVVMENVGRYLLVTKQGRVGYSAKPTNTGDRICYFPGGQHLHVLSSSCDRYVTAACIPELFDDALLDIVGSNPTWTPVTLR